MNHTIRTKCYFNSKVKKSCKSCEEKELCEKEVNTILDEMDIKYKWYPQNETPSEKRNRIDLQLEQDFALICLNKGELEK